MTRKSNFETVVESGVLEILAQLLFAERTSQKWNPDIYHHLVEVPNGQRRVDDIEF